jgi:hypothetical protein
MKLNNIVSASAEILGLGESNRAILKRCAGLVLANIAANYRDCIAVQKFNTADGLVKYTAFDRTFLRVLSVRAGGAEVPHSLYIDCIKVPAGAVEIRYAYVPAFDEEGTADVTIPNLTEQGFTYGVLAEYAFISGMFNEAKIWNEKFEQALFNKSKYKKVKMPIHNF